MILIDTDGLESMVTVLQTANESITEAASILNAVTAHNDWGCKERDALNELIESMKEHIQVLQSSNGGFYSIMRQIASEFVQTESGISALFESVENVLKAIYSSPVATVITGVVETVTSGSTLSQVVSGLLGSTINMDQDWSSFDLRTLLASVGSATYSTTTVSDSVTVDPISTVSLDSLEL